MRKSILLSKASSGLLWIVLLTSAACTSLVTPSSTTPRHTPVQTRVSPTHQPTTPINLTVLAAASLTESFTELGKMFETQNPGVKVSFSFAGSQQLAQQLSQGAEADVFASASQKYMDAVVDEKRVDPNSPKVFVKNRLVIIFPKDNPANLSELRDLAKAGLKLDLADKSVPIGQYALDFLDKAAHDPALAPNFKANVIKNVVSYEDSVKSVVTKVSLGEADAGIVYVTDITPEAANNVGKLDIPDALNTIAVYPIALILDSKNADLANAFIALVLSPTGQQVMAEYGFIPAAEGSGS